MEPKELGELGNEIMQIIWKEERSTLKDITLRLRKKRKIAYTTVATILQRLYERGMVKKVKEGKRHFYTPSFSKETYLSRLIKAFINKTTSTYGDLAISSFVEGLDSLPKSKKDYLLSLLHEIKRA